MVDFVALLDNREKAILVWFAIGAGLALRNEAVRSSLVAILRTALSRAIVIVFAALLVYVGLAILVAVQLGIWTSEMTMATVIWLFGSGLIMVFNSQDANHGPAHFRKILLATFKFSVALTFVVNFYVFHIAIELLLVPFLFLLGAFLAVAGTKREFAPAKRLLDYVAIFVGLSLLTYALVRLLTDIDGFASVDTLTLIVLPIALTLWLIPFIYALALYLGYESIFVRAKVIIKDQDVERYVRRQILFNCSFRLHRVNRFLRGYAGKFARINSKSDAVAMIEEFKAAESA